MKCKNFYQLATHLLKTIKDRCEHAKPILERITCNPVYLRTEGVIMYENFGAFVKDNNTKTVEFRVFFPDKNLDPGQYTVVDGQDGNPRIAKIQVAGTFQSALGGKDFDFENAPTLEPSLFPSQNPIGHLYTFKTDLPENFYQYKYLVTFESGEQRECSDPCTKYGGGSYIEAQNRTIMQTAGFVIGGNFKKVEPIPNRLPQKDLIIYELMVEDFITELIQKNKDRAFLDAVKDKIDYLLDLGINAIEFLPWTAFIEDGFSWGYDPYLYFSVENRYTSDPKNPKDKLFKLQELISFLHQKNIHVIMDGVFHQTNAQGDPQNIRQSSKQVGSGFPYYWLYENPDDSPFIRKPNFGEDSFGQKLLNFNNHCTLQFIADSCKYFINEFEIDGIRFDDAKGYYTPGDQKGIPALISSIKSDLADKHKENISLILEDLNGFNEIDDTNKIDATGCWFDEFRYYGISTQFLRVLNANLQFAAGKAPVCYIENHDHSTIVTRFFGRDKGWFRTQPLAIALLTSPGTVMLHNGQEFGEDYYFPEPGAPGDDQRVVSRPLHWDEFSNDSIGKRLYELYQKLISIRRKFSTLRSPNFYPDIYDDSQTHFNSKGYGIDVDKQVVIYHRWGNNGNKLDRFIIVINFSENDQVVDIPFGTNGKWDDLLSDLSDDVSGFKLYNQKINSNWGRIYYQSQTI